MQDLFFYDTGKIKLPEGENIPLVFIHGFCESSTIWRSLSEELSKEFRIIYPDLPGFGKSALPENDFLLSDIGDALVSWIKGLEIERCIVIGHSLGGYIALEMLRRHPDLVSGIGLFNSSAFEDSTEKKDNRNKLISFIRTHGVDPFLKTFVPSLFYPETAHRHAETIARISAEGMSIKPDAVIKYAAAMRDRADSTDLLTMYRDRILLISGEFDQNIPLEKSQEMAALLDEENVHIIPESAHMSLFEQSEMCYEAIKSYARKF